MQVAVSLLPLQHDLAQDWAVRACQQRVQTHELQAVSPGAGSETIQSQHTDTASPWACSVGRYQQPRGPTTLHTDNTYLV